MKGKLLTEKAASHILTIYYCIIQGRCNCFNCAFNCEDMKSTLLQVPALTYWERFGHSQLLIGADSSVRLCLQRFISDALLLQ